MLTGARLCSKHIQRLHPKGDSQGSCPLAADILVGRGRKYTYEPIEVSGNKVLGTECVCQEALSEEMIYQLRPEGEEGASPGEMGEERTVSAKALRQE